MVQVLNRLQEERSSSSLSALELSLVRRVAIPGEPIRRRLEPCWQQAEFPRRYRAKRKRLVGGTSCRKRWCSLSQPLRVKMLRQARTSQRKSSECRFPPHCSNRHWSYRTMPSRSSSAESHSMNPRLSRQKSSCRLSAGSEALHVGQKFGWKSPSLMLLLSHRLMRT